VNIMGKIRHIIVRKPRKASPEGAYRCGHCGGEFLHPAGRRRIRRFCAQADRMVWAKRVGS
jgi:hypothetical protein